MLPPSGWILFGGIALVLVSAVFLPSLVRRWRGLPRPQPLSYVDIRLAIMITLAGCALAVFGVFSEMWWLMAFAILFAPLSFTGRYAEKQQRDRGKCCQGPSRNKIIVNETDENADPLNRPDGRLEPFSDSGKRIGDHVVYPLVLNATVKKERIMAMVYALHSRCCVDFELRRGFGWPARYCGIRPGTRHLDDQLRSNHGKDSRSYGASTYRSP